MRTVALTLVLLAVPLRAADPAVKLPERVKGDVGAFVQVPADSAQKEVRWLSPDPGLNLFPAHLLKDSKTAVVTAPRAGSYRLYAWTAAGDVPSEAAVCVVEVGTPPAPPPGPTPPTPPPPPPTDPLLAPLKAAFAADLTDGKEAKAKFLAALFRAATRDAKDPANPTPGTLLSLLRTASQRELKEGDLAPVRQLVSGELKAAFPDLDAPFDAAGRERAAALFVRLAGLLEQL